ncbi:hypothetical protein [Microtetraspora malaysiensis]|uniref:Uncharacterized protein n=1 Tax=Microtetraspora malaysiensis TaxID=161358 RepID=A0ABW6SRL2_9ACTN
MKYVNPNATINGLDGVLDPSEYVRQLPALAPDLPVGARAFATDAGHYDFSSRRCVKDLALGRVTVTEDDAGMRLDIGFRHNCWKHEEDLSIGYVGVSVISTCAARICIAVS